MLAGHPRDASELKLIHRHLVDGGTTRFKFSANLKYAQIVGRSCLREGNTGVPVAAFATVNDFPTTLQKFRKDGQNLNRLVIYDEVAYQ